MESVTKPTAAQLHCTDMRVRPFIRGAWPIVKLKLASRPLGSKLAGLWRETGTDRARISTHGGGGRGGEGDEPCIVSSECGGRARLVASWPPAPDGCIIDAHPSSRAAGATGRVQCDGARGRDRLGRSLNRAGGRV